MKKKRFLVALAAVAILIPLLVGCDAFGTGAPPPATSGIPASIPQLEGRMSSLESRVSSVEGKITDTSTLQTDLEQLRTDFDAFVATATEEEGTTTELAATISELNDRIAALEKQFDEEEEENGGATGETARWYWEVYALNNLDRVSAGTLIICPGASCSTSSSRVEEADDYKVYLEFHNEAGSNINDLQLGLTFRPKTGSRVVVDEDEVYLETIKSPFYRWDVEVSTRKTDETCRDIAFTSGKIIAVPAGTPEEPGVCRLELIFTLAYE